MGVRARMSPMFTSVRIGWFLYCCSGGWFCAVVLVTALFLSRVVFWLTGVYARFLSFMRI